MALLRSPAEKTGLPRAAIFETLELLPLRDRLSRFESRRATLTVVLKLGVRESGVLMDELRE